MVKPFCYTVNGVLHIADVFSRKVNPLMVGAVDGKAFSVKAKQKGVRKGSGGMNLVLSVVLVERGGGKVLKQVAAAVNIDELHSFTNAKDRLPVQNEALQDSKLQTVKSRLDDT